MPRRLFVVWTNPLFRDAIRLLLDHPEIDLIGSTSDYAAAPAAISELKPDTILAEEIDGHLATTLLETNCFDVQLISFNLEDNRLLVFERHRENIGQADDLLRLILH